MHTVAAPLPPLGLHSLIGLWQFTPWLDLAVLISLAAYTWGMATVARAHPARPWQWWRGLAFLGGLAVIVVAVDSSVGAIAPSLPAASMPWKMTSRRGGGMRSAVFAAS